MKVDLTPSEYARKRWCARSPRAATCAAAKCCCRAPTSDATLVAEELRKQGAEVTEVVAYRTVVVEADREGEPDIYRMLLERRIDVVTFTSASAVRNFVRVLGAEPAADLLRTTVVASIGPVTAEAASQYNIETTIVPANYTIPALVDAIVEHFEREHELQPHE